MLGFHSKSSHFKGKIVLPSKTSLTPGVSKTSNYRLVKTSKKNSALGQSPSDFSPLSPRPASPKRRCRPAADSDSAAFTLEALDLDDLSTFRPTRGPRATAQALADAGTVAKDAGTAPGGWALQRRNKGEVRGPGAARRNMGSKKAGVRFGLKMLG